MEQVALKQDPQKPGYYIVENVQSLPEGVHVRVSVRAHVWRPPTDIYEVEDAVIVRVEIAGMREDDFTIILDGRNLAIRGARLDTTERRAYHQMEIPFGEFSTDVELPCAVASKGIEAVYTHGFLRINLPKNLTQKVTIQG